MVYCICWSVWSTSRDLSFLHLDWLDHSSIAMSHLIWPGQGFTITSSWSIWRYLWRKCQIISYCCLIIPRNHFLWIKWGSRTITTLCKGSQSLKTTLGYQISENDRSHLSVIDPSELRAYLLKLHFKKSCLSKRTPLKPLLVVQIALEFTFWLQFSSRHSVAWAVGAKILLIYHPFLWQETLFIYLSLHRNPGIILFQGNTTADDFRLACDTPCKYIYSQVHSQQVISYNFFIFL